MTSSSKKTMVRNDWFYF